MIRHLCCASRAVYMHTVIGSLGIAVAPAFPEHSQNCVQRILQMTRSQSMSGLIRDCIAMLMKRIEGLGLERLVSQMAQLSRTAVTHSIT